MTRIERYFRSYFPDQQDLVVFMLTYTIKQASPRRGLHVLTVEDKAGANAKLPGIPHQVVFKARPDGGYTVAELNWTDSVSGGFPSQSITEFPKGKPLRAELRK